MVGGLYAMLCIVFQVFAKANIFQKLRMQFYFKIAKQSFHSEANLFINFQKPLDIDVASSSIIKAGGYYETL